MIIGTSFECEFLSATDPNPSDTHTAALIGPVKNWLTLEGNLIKLDPKLNPDAGFYTLELLITDNNSA